MEEWDKVAFEEDIVTKANIVIILDFNPVLNKIKNVFDVSYNFFHGARHACIVRQALLSAHPLLSAIIGKPGGSNGRVLVA